MSCPKNSPPLLARLPSATWWPVVTTRPLTPWVTLSRGTVVWIVRYVQHACVWRRNYKKCQYFLPTRCCNHLFHLQERVFGGWPEEASQLQVLHEQSPRDRQCLVDHCSRKSQVSFPPSPKDRSTKLVSVVRSISSQDPVTARSSSGSTNQAKDSDRKQVKTRLSTPRAFVKRSVFSFRDTVGTPKHPEHWSLAELAPPIYFVRQKYDTVQCSTPGCGLMACVHYRQKESVNEWFGCLDCQVSYYTFCPAKKFSQPNKRQQEIFFGGWPPGEELRELGVRRFGECFRDHILANCSRRMAAKMPGDNVREELVHLGFEVSNRMSLKAPTILSFSSSFAEPRFPREALAPRQWKGLGELKLVEVASTQYLRSNKKPMKCWFPDCSLCAVCHYVSEEKTVRSEWFCCLECQVGSRRQSSS